MKIIWSEPAISDLENIRDYIAKDSGYYAAIFIEKIIAAIEKAATFPHTDLVPRLRRSTR